MSKPALPGPHEGRFKGQIAIVTGWASGIGEATCRRLVAEGATVVVADVNAERAAALASELGPRASAQVFDAADVRSIERLVQGTVDRFGRLDVLHNNAALSSPAIHAKDKNAIDIEFEVWDQVMAVNLRGYLAGCKYALPTMIAQGGGAIVNTASTGGFSGDITRMAYSVSKAAIIGLTRQTSRDLGPFGITINAVAPGFILSGARIEDYWNNKKTQEERDEVLERTPMQRPGTSDDIAATVAFLAGENASFITGAVFDVHGGLWVG